MRKLVALSRSPQHTNDSDGFFESLSPATCWCAIQPLTAGDNARSLTHLVTMRWHPQVTMDTRLVYEDPIKGTRELFVRGFQNIDEQNVELRCLCEEVIP